LGKIIAVWQNVSVVQRALLIALLLTFVAAGALLVHWAGQPDMRMLYDQLNPQEAGKITEQIEDQGIEYELKNGGRTIYVSREKVYQLRLDLAREGLPSGDKGGYEIFDKGKIGVSPFVQNVNLQRALQNELAKSIEMIEGVTEARVHIVNTEETLFANDRQKPTSAVILKLKPGFRPGNLSIASITHLVAGSVKGLDASNVTVVDSKGQLLAGESDGQMAQGAGTVQDYRQRVENNLSSKVEDMLTAVLGPGKAKVRVSAVLNMTQSSVVTESYDPSTKVSTKEEIETNTETEPGKIQQGGGNNSQQVIPGGTKKEETIVSEYAVGKTTEERVDMPGDIQSLSVAAFVDLSEQDPNATTGQMQVSDIEEVIRTALGLQSADSLKVVATKFHRPKSESIKEADQGWGQYLDIVRQGSLGVMAVCALLVLKMFSGKRPKGSGATADVQALGEGQNRQGLLGSGEQETSPLGLRKHIAAALQENPEQVKQLFSNWLEERG